MLKILYTHLFFILLVLEKNQCFCYISCVTILLVHYFDLFLIHHFFEFDLLKSSSQ